MAAFRLSRPSVDHKPWLPAHSRLGAAMPYKLSLQGGNTGGSDVSAEAPVRGHMRAHVVCGGGKRTGSGSCRPSSAGRGRASGTGIACGLGMDTRILPLERKALYLGCWTLGSATPASRSLDPRPMGSSRWRLGLDQRLLALTQPRDSHPLRPACFSNAMRDRISTSTMDWGDSLKRCT